MGWGVCVGGGGLLLLGDGALAFQLLLERRSPRLTRTPDTHTNARTRARMQVARARAHAHAPTHPRTHAPTHPRTDTQTQTQTQTPQDREVPGSIPTDATRRYKPV